MRTWPVFAGRDGTRLSLCFAMRLGDDYRVALYHDPWRRAAADLGLAPDRLRVRVRELTVAAPDAVADAASAPQVASLGSELPGRLVDLIARRSARCRRMVEAAEMA